MADPILDDVQKLLDKEFGDKRILEQILRAAQNDEVISNFERNYVRKLKERYLEKKPSPQPSEQPKEISPNFTIPSTVPFKPQPVQTLSSPKTTKSNSKNPKIMLGVGVAILALIIIAAISLGGVSEISSKPEIVQPSTTSKSFSVKTDSSAYSKGDIISISGDSQSKSGNANLSIKNPDNKMVWSEEVQIKSDGKFSTLTFAGGSGWEKSGEYTVTADVNSKEVTSTFSFKG